MKIGTAPLAPRPACDDLPTVETRGQCKLPTAHLDEAKALETEKVKHEALHQLGHETKTQLKDAVGVKLLAKAGLTGISHEMHAMHPLFTAIDVTKGLKDFANVFPELAKLRTAAVGRENHDLAMAFVADQSKKGVFPEGYIASRRDTLMGGAGKLGDARHTPHVVNTVVAQMDKAVEANHAGAKQYVSYWATNASAGVREAQAENIRDQRSLDVACKDPKFKSTFENDAAFREGVRAGMWQARVHPEAFDAARASMVNLRDQAAQAQLGRPS